MMRSVGDKIRGLNGEDIVIGAEIPPIRIMTVEVRYSPSDQNIHDEKYSILVRQLDKDTKDRKSSSILGEQNTRTPYMRVMRRLCLLGFNPLLDDFLRVIGSENTLSEMVSLYVGARDHGFTAFWITTCPVSADPRPVDAFQQVLYLVKQSPRLRELLRIMKKEGAFEDRKNTNGPRARFLIVSHWPIVNWMVEMVLRRIGIKSCSITATMPAQDRAAAVAVFNDPNSDCQALTTTYNCGGTVLNLHSWCTVIILVEPALNLNLETQAIGRIHRIGQTRPQKAYRLFQDHTICRYYTGNNLLKMVPQLAAQYPETFGERAQQQMARMEVSTKDAHEIALSKVCEEHLRCILGMTDDFPRCEKLLDKPRLGLVLNKKEGITYPPRRSYLNRKRDKKAKRRPVDAWQEPAKPDKCKAKTDEQPVKK
jgi:hypothetical protein